MHLSDLDHDQERKDARFAAAVARIDPAVFAQEIADLIAGESDPSLCPFQPLVRELLDNPPAEHLGDPYYSCTIPEAILLHVGRGIRDYAQRAFERLLDHELERDDD